MTTTGLNRLLQILDLQDRQVLQVLLVQTAQLWVPQETQALRVQLVLKEILDLQVHKVYMLKDQLVRTDLLAQLVQLAMKANEVQ